MAGHPRGSLALRLRHRLMTLTPTAPSFARHHAEAQRVRALAAARGVVEPVWSVNAKQDAYRWVDGVGLRRPAQLGAWGSVDEVDLGALPDRVVLKPDAGSGSHGVLLLERGATGWLDLVKGGVRSDDDVRAELRGLAGSGTISASLTAEEMVDDPARPGAPPVDWKFYTFFGRVGLVLARAPGAPHVRWRVFDGDWQDLGQAYAGHPQDPGVSLPRHAQALHDWAAWLSACIPRPFLRVDLYDDCNGPVFGELTPEPGGAQRFRRDVDRRLGDLWEDAEARLLARVAATGVLDPAEAPLPEAAIVSPFLRRPRV